MRLRHLAIASLVVALLGCDKGLEPPASVVQTTISGTIHFSARWPRPDSAAATVLALIIPPPPFSDSELIKGLNTTVIPISLNYRSSDTTFSFANLKAGVYGYLGVAQLYGSDPYKDWRVVGFAHDAHDSALSFNVVQGTVIPRVDIWVNFDSMPRQPFIQ